MSLKAEHGASGMMKALGYSIGILMIVAGLAIPITALIEGQDFETAIYVAPIFIVFALVFALPIYRFKFRIFEDRVEIQGLFSKKIWEYANIVNLGKYKVRSFSGGAPIGINFLEVQTSNGKWKKMKFPHLKYETGMEFMQFLAYIIQSRNS